MISKILVILRGSDIVQPLFGNLFGYRDLTISGYYKTFNLAIVVNLRSINQIRAIAITFID